MSIDPSLLTTAAMDDGEVEQGPLGADEFYVGAPCALLPAFRLCKR